MTVKGIYNEFINDTKGILKELKTFRAKEGYYCDNSKAECQIARREINGDRKIFFNINDDTAQCTIRDLSPGPNDFHVNCDKGISAGNKYNFRFWNDYAIDMNGHLDCGCYDKNNKWNDFKYIQYAHIYGMQQLADGNEFRNAFKEMENIKFNNAPINRNSLHGFVTHYECNEGYCPLYIAIVLNDKNNWTTNKHINTATHWEKIKNTCVSIHKQKSYGEKRCIRKIKDVKWIIIYFNLLYLLEMVLFKN